MLCGGRAAVKVTDDPRIRSLEERCAALEQRNEELERQNSLYSIQLEHLGKTQLVSFSVAQYNILAGYLGDNRQPWFLYGVTI